MKSTPAHAASTASGRGAHILAPVAACSMTLVLTGLIGCSTSDSEARISVGTSAYQPMPMAPMDRGDLQGTSSDRHQSAGRDPIDLTDGTVPQQNVCVPTIIDTTTWQPQLANTEPFEGEQQNTGWFRPKKDGRPQVVDGPPNDLIASRGVLDAERATPQVFFPGITASPWNPPDPALAVGPDHVLETVNMEISWFTKDGTQQFQQRLDSSGSPGFFEEVGAGDFTFDPKCFYDHYVNRYFVVALEVYNSQDEAWITIAVSDDDDPNGIWYKYRTWASIGVGNTEYWVDYPGYGFDEEAMYITGNLFRLSGPGNGFGGVVFRTFDKADMLNGDPVTFTDIRDGNGASVQVAQCFGDNPAPYFVSRANSTQMRIQAIQNPLTSPVLVTTTVGVPFFQGPGADAPNLGGGGIDTLDGRIMNVHWRDGNLYAAHAINGPSSRTVARWYHFNTNNWPDSGSPTLVQSGEVDGGSGVHTFFPAIYSNKFHDVGMVVARSSSSTYASVEVTGRSQNDALGSMAPPTQLVIGNGGTNGRWGDYFDIAIDPTDDTTFWIVGEYYENGGWRTWLADFVITEPCPADIAGDPGVGVDDVLLLLSNWGTDGPGAAIAEPTDVVDVSDLLEMLALFGGC